MDCFAIARNDAKCHAESKPVILRALARRILCKKRSFGFHPQDDRVLKKKAAFTLAEVIITLGIIGIVAAMTLPTLINNYRKTVTVNQLKVAYSIMTQALTMAQKDYGDMTYWEIGEHMSIDPDNSDAVNDSLNNFVSKYIAPYLKVITYCQSGTKINSACNYSYVNMRPPSTVNMLGNNKLAFITENGMIFRLEYENTYDDTGTFGRYIYFEVDLNGKQKPNRTGEDIFAMYLDTKMSKMLMFGHERSRNQILNGTGGRGCNKSATGYCGALIMMDGWQIRDDYPFFN